MAAAHANEQKASYLRHLGGDALRARAAELLGQIHRARFQSAMKEKNVKKLRELRRYRARVLTLLREQEGRV